MRGLTRQTMGIRLGFQKVFQSIYVPLSSGVIKRAEPGYGKK